MQYKRPMSDDTTPHQPSDVSGTTGRRALLLGVVGASAVVSIRPALAQTAGSVLTCEIAVPDRGRAGNWIAADGRLVLAGTEGAYPPGVRAYKGEEVRRALSGSTLPDTDAERSRAYVNYIGRLQRGQGGSPASRRCRCRVVEG